VPDLGPLGQSFGAGLAVPPDPPPDVPAVARGVDVAVGDADGSGLAALTIATPPAAIRPMASRSMAIIRRGPESCGSRRGRSAGGPEPIGLAVSIGVSSGLFGQEMGHWDIGGASWDGELSGRDAVPGRT
jgi:hypothetical protein